MMANCIKRGKTFRSHITLMANMHWDQQKLVYGLAYSLSSYQVHCTVMILSQIATDLHICAVFISFLRVLWVLFVGMQDLVLFKMVAAELVSSNGDFLNASSR